MAAANFTSWATARGSTAVRPRIGQPVEDEGVSITVTYTNPENHIQLPEYHHLAIARGTRQVYLAGQVAWDEHGELVSPGDLAGQVAQVYRDITKGLTAAGATFHDVVRITWYAAGWKHA
jgi:enamine deaminase RidA (YjgF/YER057c/UK114 family)